MVMLYHYTDIDGLRGILESRLIRSSTTFKYDACYGDGVYLTAIRPHAGRFRILRNNYDDDGVIHYNPRIKDRASYFLKIHSSWLDGVQKVPLGHKRCVFLYDDDIDLDDVEYEIGETSALKWSRCLYDKSTGIPYHVGLVND